MSNLSNQLLDFLVSGFLKAAETTSKVDLATLKPGIDPSTASRATFPTFSPFFLVGCF